MSNINIKRIVRGFGLAISSLVAVWSLASCGTQNVGSLDLPEQDADAAAAARSERGVSYTPGAPCVIGAGIAWQNVLNYGWFGGGVTEGFGPNWVKLSPAVGANNAWIEYHFQEGVIGRLQALRFVGSGNNLNIYMYNFNTATWTNFGAFNLGGGPVNLGVGLPYAPNGVTYVRLVQQPGSASQVDRIRTNVF